MPSTPAPEGGDLQSRALFDAGVFIGALLVGDRRHEECRSLVERARRGKLPACTTAGILSEVYGALTWEGANPRHQPEEAAQAVRLLVEAPSEIVVINETLTVALRSLELAVKFGLTARRAHDGRHAAAALEAGIACVYTYDPEDWKVFEGEGLHIVGPATTLARLSRPGEGSAR